MGSSQKEPRYLKTFIGAHTKEELFEYWKRDMNSVLNLNTAWTIGNFLNYIIVFMA